MLHKLKQRDINNIFRSRFTAGKKGVSKRSISSNNLNNDPSYLENTNNIMQTPTTTTMKENHSLSSTQTSTLKNTRKNPNKSYINFPISWNKNQKNNKQVLYWKSVPANQIGIKEYSYNTSPRSYLTNEPKFISQEEEATNQQKKAIMLSSRTPLNVSPLKDTWNEHLTKQHGSPSNYELGENGRFIMATLGTLYTLAKQKPHYFDLPYLGGSVKHPHDTLNRANLRLLNSEKGISLNGLEMDFDWRQLPKEWFADNSRFFFKKPVEHIIEEEVLPEEALNTSMLSNSRSSNSNNIDNNALDVFSNNISDILRHHNQEMEKKKNVKGRKRNKLNKIKN